MGSSSSFIVSKQTSLQLSNQSLEEFNKCRQQECEQYPNKLNPLDIYNKLTCKFDELIEKDHILINSSIMNINDDSSSLSNEVCDESQNFINENELIPKELLDNITQSDTLSQSIMTPYTTVKEYLGSILESLFLISKDHDEDNINENVLITESCYCELCSMSFDSKDILNLHYQSSYSHSKNKKVFEELEHELQRLHSVAEEVVDTMHINNDINDTKVSKSKMHWRKTKDTLLDKQLVMKFKERLTGHIDLPWGIELLFSGSKYFHKNKQTYDLKYFLHIKYDIVEIIPHLIPFSHAENRLTNTNIESFTNCRRLYVCYTELLKSFFHYKNFRSDLTEILKSTVNETGIIFQLHASKSFKYAEYKALGSYITNNLKIHKSKPTSHPRLYLSLPENIQSSIIYQSIPKYDGFESLKIDKTFIKNAWTLNELHQA